MLDFLVVVFQGICFGFCVKVCSMSDICVRTQQMEDRWFGGFDGMALDDNGVVPMG